MIEEIDFRVKGEERKKLAYAIGELLGMPVKYTRTPNVYTDQKEHTARRFSAWLPPIQCTLSGHQCMMLIQV